MVGRCSPVLGHLRGPKTSPENPYLTFPRQAAHEPHLRPDTVLEGEPPDLNPAPVTPVQTGIAGGAEVAIALISPPHISAVWKAAPWGLGHL